jgi:hypothetical protein
MCNMMLFSRRVHDVMLCLCYIFCFSSPSSFHHLPLPSLLCHTTLHYTAHHYITSVCAALSDVKKKNGSDDGSDDAPPSPQKAVKGASKQTWGAKSKGTVMCTSIPLLICSCLVCHIFFSLLYFFLFFTTYLTPSPFTPDLLFFPTSCSVYLKLTLTLHPSILLHLSNTCSPLSLLLSPCLPAFLSFLFSVIQ